MSLTRSNFRRLCRARELLSRLEEPLPTVRGIARDVEISPFHFIRQFEAVFGLTPHQFRTATRIEYAKRSSVPSWYPATLLLRAKLVMRIKLTKLDRW
ncbi:MAG TPA: AraC family transcriptional regulator [Myxococcaceae bacterium]|nr:AraC family transcriptional regulator [Myxococcaceae bacterium]